MAKAAESKPDYETMTVAQLKEMAKEKGIEDFNTMRKQELIDALKAK